MWLRGTAWPIRKLESMWLRRTTWPITKLESFDFISQTRRQGCNLRYFEGKEKRRESSIALAVGEKWNSVLFRERHKTTFIHLTSLVLRYAWIYTWPDWLKYEACNPHCRIISYIKTGPIALEIWITWWGPFFAWPLILKIPFHQCRTQR